MESDVSVLQSIANTLENEPHASQRTLAKDAGMSLGMMNAILGRFVERGWIMLTNVNLRKLSYAVTPEGFSKLFTRSRQFAKRTFEIANVCHQTLYDAVKNAKSEGKKKVILYGKSYIKFMIAYVCSQLEVDFEERKINEKFNPKALCLVGELEEEELQKNSFSENSFAMSVLDMVDSSSYPFEAVKALEN